MSTSINIFTWLGLLLLLLAVGMLIRGRKRWIGNDPHCRKCNYLLHGLESQRCPECGAMLSPAAIVHGQPQRRWISFLTGWLVILMLAAFLTTGGVSKLQSIDWYRYEPTYFVLRDLNSSQPPTVQRAWTELMRRDSMGTLSPETRDKLVRFALAQQANANAPFNSLDTDTINYLGNRFAAGDLPADQRTKLFEQSIRMHLVVRSKVIVGDPVPYLLICDGLGPAPGRFWTKLSMSGAAIDGKPIQGNTGGYSAFGGFGGGSMGSSVNSPSPGKHQLSLTFRVEVFHGPFDSRGLTPIYRADPTFSANFEVLSRKPANFIQPIFDPKLAASLSAAIAPGYFRYSALNKSLDGDVQITNARVNLACDVFLRFNGTDHPLCQLTYNTKTGTCGYSINGELKSPPPPTVDLILRPSEKAALDTADLQSYWNQEIVLLNIPVAWH